MEIFTPRNTPRQIYIMAKAWNILILLPLSFIFLTKLKSLSYFIHIPIVNQEMGFLNLL